MRLEWTGHVGSGQARSSGSYRRRGMVAVFFTGEVVDIEVG
jgi:hypothetical protein